MPALPAEPRRPRIALTAGEPAGVGPELVAQVLAEDFRADLVVIASRQLLIERALAAGTLPGSDGNAACGFECVDIALSAMAGLLINGTFMPAFRSRDTPNGWASAPAAMSSCC